MITLRTKNGSKSGNAIIYGGIESTPSPRFPLEPEMPPVFFVETDFGNHMTLTWREIESMFTIGEAMDYREWRERRRKLQELSTLLDRKAEPSIAGSQ